MFYERLTELCNKKNVKISTVTMKILNMGGGNLDRWRKGSSPTGDTLIKFANYFSVTTDYLLGLTETPHKNNFEISMHETKVLEAYRAEAEEGKKLIDKALGINE